MYLLVSKLCVHTSGQALVLKVKHQVLIQDQQLTYVSVVQDFKLQVTLIRLEAEACTPRVCLPYACMAQEEDQPD